MVQEISFKDISYHTNPFSAEQTICAIFVEGIMSNISAKLFLIGSVGQDKKSFENISHLELWQPLY